MRRGMGMGWLRVSGDVAGAWMACMELEKRLKAESRKLSFWDPEVRRLRLALQAAYEGVMFGDYAFAVVSVHMRAHACT